ncbi:hypothetical protein [Actinomyces sp. MRS3W]|nr:hypothetical protein [Actinomyces sp. MRS3W]MDU0347302.1 hypothetical protein [Actinomyces sp. MRS3W]
MPSNKMISDFSGKPKTDSFYQTIDDDVMSLGEIRRVPFTGQPQSMEPPR